jgi:2-polyprenyl-3-methyl-5-hydroxy-6-metoxy-1,4-benzoquinol methylase
MACAICKSNNIFEAFHNTLEASEWILNKKKYRYQSCRNCGFIQSDPIPTEEELIDFYKNEYAYEWFKSNSFYKKIQGRHRLYKIMEYMSACEKLLDFGCGHGFFVEASASKGFDSYGFDIGVDKIINSQGYKIVNKNSLSLYEEKGFDIITAWHVIEHMIDANQIIIDLRGRLKKNGKLIIAVPNTDSLGFKLFKQKWGWIQQPYVHINHFNSNNLSILLANNGFELVSVKTFDTWDQNLYDLLITKLFYRRKSRNAVRKFEGDLKGQVIFKLNQIVRLVFTVISYAYSFLRKTKKEGSELMIVAQKKD